MTPVILRYKDRFRKSPQRSFNFGKISVDNFAGGGGASTGIEAATGRPVDIAINHDPVAIEMHKVNHPGTHHECESVWKINPREICAGRPVGLAWFSPDCKHHSKARGKKPVDKKIRGLAWVAVRWMATVKPDLAIVENVEEFVSWGPLIQDANGEFFPCPIRKGQIFKSFINAIRRHGYEVDWRELRASDYGAPTIRKRFFLVARCDGKEIVWPEPTHGNPKSAEVKNGQLKPWRTVAECIDFSIPCPSIFERKKTLVNATLRRIAKSIKRYVIDADEPFVAPPTALVASASQKQDLASTFLSEYTGENAAAQTLKVASIMRHFGESVGSSLDEPVGTITAGGMGKTSLVVATLVRSFGKSAGAAADTPACTITSKSKDMLVTSHLIKLRGTCKDGQPVSKPGPTLTAGGNHIGEVRTLLMKFTGSKWPLDHETDFSPWLVTVRGEKYEIVDIGARMLSPRELYRVQGFTDDYIIDRDSSGKKITATEQVNKCGNSVCPPVAEALVRANMYAVELIHQAELAGGE